MQQLSFEFPIKLEQNPYLLEDFIISEENKAAFDFLTNFFNQKIDGQLFFNAAILSGANHCGKTHLLNIFHQQNQNLTSFIRQEELSGVNLNSFFYPNHFYILEDIENIYDQQLLLHLINSAIEKSSFLILTSKIEATNLKFEIDDLNSRIKNMPNPVIKSPNKKLIKILLTKNFAKKQLAIDNKILELITDTIADSYEAVFNIVKIIEFYCQEYHQKPTLSSVNKLIKNISLNHGK